MFFRFFSQTFDNWYWWYYKKKLFSSIPSKEKKTLLKWDRITNWVFLFGKVSLAFWWRVNELIVCLTRKQHKPLCELGQSWQKAGCCKKLQWPRCTNLYGARSGQMFTCRCWWMRTRSSLLRASWARRSDSLPAHLINRFHLCQEKRIPPCIRHLRWRVFLTDQLCPKKRLCWIFKNILN